MDNKMESAVVDIGSNSVRLFLHGKKYIENTQLAENLLTTGFLDEKASERTIFAIENFCKQAKNNGIKQIYAFATEAVRKAKNGLDFLHKVENLGIKAEILSPKDEARAGFLGAYSGKGQVAVLDIGGASSELSIGNEKEILYTYSLPLGCVKLKDFSLDIQKQADYVQKIVLEYGKVPHFDRLTAIGGTVTQLCAVNKELSPYDPEKVHNSQMSFEEIAKTVKKIADTPIELRRNIIGLNPKKIYVAPAGGVLLLGIMKYLGCENLVVSETDNLEGYIKIRGIK